MHVIAEISIQSNATENRFSRQTDTRQSEVIGKAAADDQRNNSNITNLNANNTNGIPQTSCCAMSFYYICFSVIKACTYWNSDTMASISDHGAIFYIQLQSLNKQHLTINDLPESLQIYDADIIVTTRGLLVIDTSEKCQFEEPKIFHFTQISTFFHLLLDRLQGFYEDN